VVPVQLEMGAPPTTEEDLEETVATSVTVMATTHGIVRERKDVLSAINLDTFRPNAISLEDCVINVVTPHILHAIVNSSLPTTQDHATVAERVGTMPVIVHNLRIMKGYNVTVVD